MTTSRPCTCERIVRGQPLRGGQCLSCWRYWQVLRYHRLWGGTGQFNAKYGTITVGGEAPPVPPPGSGVTTAPDQGGPGSELKAMLAALGFGDELGCGCNAKVEEMNRWGVEGCKARRAEIIQWLEEQRAGRGWGEQIAAAGRAAVAGFLLNPFDLLGSLVDLAISRAERAANRGGPGESREAGPPPAP